MTYTKKHDANTPFLLHVACLDRNGSTYQRMTSSAIKPRTTITVTGTTTIITVVLPM